MSKDNDIVFGRSFPQVENIRKKFKEAQDNTPPKANEPPSGGKETDEQRLEDLIQKQPPARHPEPKPPGMVGSHEAKRQQDFSRIRRLASRLNERRQEIREEKEKSLRERYREAEW
ncbi:MAG TPA: hypothetical protein VNQ90_08310 [Chthoniobacteraceae bacterium]|nr:hypothetical protein [Chthoniobacteraceae bacterium]